MTTQIQIQIKKNLKSKKQKPKYDYNHYNNNFINPRLLNVNTILKSNLKSNIKGPNNYENINDMNTNKQNTIDIDNDIKNINNIFNNNLTINKNVQNVQNVKNMQNMQNVKNMQNMQNLQKNYNIVKYLGEGIQGSLYLANDSNKKRYICKKINLNESGDSNDSNNTNKLKQIEFELNILKYLSSNKVAKDYVNPCLEYKIFNNQVFTIFPIFDGYSLNHLTNYLKKLDNSEYYKIVFHIIKTILFGLSKIHQSKIAHQNINNNSILVSTYKNPKEIAVKFTDFGLGCGNKDNFANNLDAIPEAMIDINKYKNLLNESNKIKYEYNSCKIHNFVPVNITDDVIDKLTDTDHLFISQKYDLLCLGIIFTKLLLYFDNIDINLQNGYSSKNKVDILDFINNKYLMNEHINNKNSENNNYKKLFPFLNLDEEILQNIIEYLKIFKEFILCKTENRKTCQYVLDKLIIYEKYKNDVF
jgi:hypothetical protein